MSNNQLLRDVLASPEWLYIPGNTSGLEEDRIGITMISSTPIEEATVPAREVFEAMDLKPADLTPTFMSFRSATGVQTYEDLGIAHANDTMGWQHLANLTGKMIKSVWLDPLSGRNAGSIMVTARPKKPR